MAQDQFTSTASLIRPVFRVCVGGMIALDSERTPPFRHRDITSFVYQAYFKVGPLKISFEDQHVSLRIEYVGCCHAQCCPVYLPLHLPDLPTCKAIAFFSGTKYESFVDTWYAATTFSTCSVLFSV